MTIHFKDQRVGIQELIPYKHFAQTLKISLNFNLKMHNNSHTLGIQLKYTIVFQLIPFHVDQKNKL